VSGFEIAPSRFGTFGPIYVKRNLAIFSILADFIRTSVGAMEESKEALLHHA
jgi:hypothetical protein